MRTIATLLIIVLLLLGPWLAIRAMDALTYPWGQPPIAWPDEPPIVVPQPPTPIIDQVPGTPGLPPPLEPGTHSEPAIPAPRSTGGDCANGQCNTQPQSSGVQYRSRIFGRRR
jgi:hypothetical protein